MNILMTLSQLEVTGAEVYATEVGNALTQRGHKVCYVSDTLTKPVAGRVVTLSFNKRNLARRVWQVMRLVALIRSEKIQLVHAHSRASGWAAAIACKITGTPMVTTVHGRQPVHASRKFFQAFGGKAIAVCEAVRDQIVSRLGVAPEKVCVARNGIDTTRFFVRDGSSSGTETKQRADSTISSDGLKELSARGLAALRNQDLEARPLTVTLIGRLTGPKGVLCERLLREVLIELIRQGRIRVRINTASRIPDWFEEFKDLVELAGYSESIADIAHSSDLVIGAGRVAAEALLCGTPVFAIGEARLIGLVTEQNLDAALACNFGDIGPKELDIDFSTVNAEFARLCNDAPHHSIRLARPSSALISRIKQEFDLQRVVDRLEEIYQDVVVETLRREMPILMYHRFIEDESEKGIHGTWIRTEMFEKHLRLLKRLGYESLTFRDFADKGFIHRLQYGKKYFMITADDGYRDNLTRMLPLLQKYGFKATVYVVSDETHNRWDTEHPTHPDTKVPLLTPDEIKALDASGAVEIGGHTLSHAKLDQLPPEEQKREIEQNKRDLESILGHPMLSFAYPFGYLNESAKQAAQAAGYQFAVATDSGPQAMHQDRYQIRRIAVFPRTDVFGLWRKVRGNYVWRQRG